MTDSVLRHCADNKKRGLPMLPNGCHQTVPLKLLALLGPHHIFYVSRQRFKICIAFSVWAGIAQSV